MKLVLRALQDDTSKQHPAVCSAALKQVFRYEDALPITVRSDKLRTNLKRLEPQLKINML
jgi:hypothetical protein